MLPDPNYLLSKHASCIQYDNETSPVKCVPMHLQLSGSICRLCVRPRPRFQVRVRFEIRSGWPVPESVALSKIPATFSQSGPAYQANPGPVNGIFFTLCCCKPGQQRTAPSSSLQRNSVDRCAAIFQPDWLQCRLPQPPKMLALTKSLLR